MAYKSYITDLHLNLHPDQIDLLPKWYEHSKQVVDFFTLAYYPYQMVDCPNGFKAEEEIPLALMNEQWAAIKKYLLEQPDDYLSFIGFEWQGTGEDGDHNIYFKDSKSAEISLPPRYQGVVENYQNQAVIGIPHHLAYSLGNRGKNWSTHNETFSPFAEIYSHHGSSERDRTNLTMEKHIHMGPRVDETSIISGLKQGKHFGIIASGDNHEVPAMVKYGRAGIWAAEYSKEGIWEAFQERRVYGFTDSKISVWTEIAGQPLGSIIRTKETQHELNVAIVANNRVERVELYKNGEIEEIHLCKIQESPVKEKTVRLKFRIECGWGPNVKYFPDFIEKIWQGSVTVAGKILAVEPVYSSFDNHFEQVNEQTVSFQAKSQKSDGGHWMRDAEMRTEGFIFEIEALPQAEIVLEIDGRKENYTVTDILSGSRVIVFEEEAKQLLQEKAAMTDYYRSDSWYHNAYKVKIHQGAVSEQYEVQTTFKLNATSAEESYFVKVIQADGQTAWCSPIWLQLIK